jgi:hypothetical protein
MKTVFVIDIDTTIANNEHRSSVLEKECMVCLAPVEVGHRSFCANCGSTDSKIKQSSWDSFLQPDVVKNDTPVPKAQDAIYKMRELGMEFHFITGRNYTLRPITEEWLQEHFGWDSNKEALIMRGEEDEGVASSVYKERALMTLIKDRDLKNARFIFMEDDPYVFRMYQQYGIVIRCPEGWEHWLPDVELGCEPTWKQ